MSEKIKMIVTDLDETLLRSDKTISGRTVETLKKCRENGVLVAFSTARDELNIIDYVRQIQPDVIISSGGALVTYCGETLYSCMFTAEETLALIRKSRELLGECEITVDTPHAHYWNNSDVVKSEEFNYLNNVYTDYSDFAEPSYKICVMTDDADTAAQIAASVDGCYAILFSDIPWHKFAKNDATKENGLKAASARLGIPLTQMAAFGDDFGDIGMMRMCGMGVAVANAIPQVLETADAVTLSNNEDGVAEYIERNILGK